MEELERNGSPRAEFFTDEDRRAMRIRIPIHQAFLQENLFDEKENLAQNERSLSEVLSEVLSENEYARLQAILNILDNKGAITPKNAAEVSGKSSATVRRYLNKLVSDGYIRVEGNTNSIVYRKV